MARKVPVNLIRFPVHIGNEGNEAVNALSKSRSKHIVFGLEPSVGYPFSEKMGWIKDWTKHKNYRYWGSFLTFRQRMDFVGNPCDVIF